VKNKLKLRRTLLALSLLSAMVWGADQPKEILLWPNGAPGSEGKTGEEVVRVTEDGEHVVSNVHKPSLTPYLPSKDKAPGVAVIIAPGGGHRECGWITKAIICPVVKRAGHRGLCAEVPSGARTEFDLQD